MKIKALKQTNETSATVTQIGMIFKNAILDTVEFICTCTMVCLINLIITGNISEFIITRTIPTNVLIMVASSAMRWLITFHYEGSKDTVHKISTRIIRIIEILIYVLIICEIIIFRY